MNKVARRTTVARTATKAAVPAKAPAPEWWLCLSMTTPEAPPRLMLGASGRTVTLDDPAVPPAVVDRARAAHAQHRRGEEYARLSHRPDVATVYTLANMQNQINDMVEELERLMPRAVQDGDFTRATPRWWHRVWNRPHDALEDVALNGIPDILRAILSDPAHAAALPACPHRTPAAEEAP